MASRKKLRKMKTDTGYTVFFHRFTINHKDDHPLKCVVEFEDGSISIIDAWRLKFIP